MLVASKLKPSVILRHKPAATIPESIISHYRDIILAGDIMCVNKIIFLVALSRHIYFGMKPIKTPTHPEVYDTPIP